MGSTLHTVLGTNEENIVNGRYYNVTLYFDGNLEKRAFKVWGRDVDNAIKIATYDASALGYKVDLIIGSTVEFL